MTLCDRDGQNGKVVCPCGLVEGAAPAVAVHRDAREHDGGSDPVGGPAELVGVIVRVGDTIDEQIHPGAQRRRERLIDLPIDQDTLHPIGPGMLRPGSCPHVPAVAKEGGDDGFAHLAGPPEYKRNLVHGLLSARCR
ncbi:protein of unknown function [Agreia sp. COWG]|nr:protein of unknown function [Agreia sp. COWG]